VITVVKEDWYLFFAFIFSNDKQLIVKEDSNKFFDGSWYNWALLQLLLAST